MWNLDIRRSIKQLTRVNYSPLQIIVGCGFGFLLGILAIRFSPILIILILIAFLFAYLTLKRPEIGLLGITVATSSIIFENQLPLLSLGGISFHISDLILLSLLGLIFLRWIVEPDFKIVNTPLDWPLIIFFGVTLLSTIIALNNSSLEFVEARRGFRTITYYFTFFIVTNLIRERRQLVFLLNGIFILATVVAAAMLIQFLLGDTFVILPGRIEPLVTQGTMFEDITRILPPGWSIIFVSFISIICILVVEKTHVFGWLKLLQCALLGLALIVTFLRSYWAVLVFILVLMAFVFKGADRQRFIRWSLITLFSASIVLLLIFTNSSSRVARLVSATANRFNTLITSETFQGQDSSLNWRLVENEYALEAILSGPWIGRGISAVYRPWDSRLDQRNPDGTISDSRNFIHNGHLLILIQSGGVGYLSLLWLSFVFLFRGYKNWQIITDDRMRAIVLAFILAYLGVLIAAWVNATFTQWRWTPIIGMMMGVNELIIKWYCPDRNRVNP